ncbi:MAG: DUF3018 family protein [Acetobacter sp.]|nr:DUF3018 family protein [Acetobacter sp.]
MTAIPLYQQVENVQVNDVPSMKSMSQEEIDRQCKLAAESDSKDVSLQEFMDDAFEDVDGWTY